jgi:hypothetical protein
MAFFCKSLESDVDLEDCPECDEYRQCKDSGYYDEIRAEHVEHSTSIFSKFSDTQLDRFNYRVYRALDPAYLKYNERKELYDYFGTGIADKPNINEDDFIPIITETGLNIKPTLLYNCAFDYLCIKSCWDKKPNPGELSASGKKIKQIKKVADALSTNVDALIGHFESLANHPPPSWESQTFQLLHKYFYETTEVRERSFEEIKVSKMKSKEQLQEFVEENKPYLDLPSWNLPFEQLRDAVINRLRENERIVPNDLGALWNELYAVAPSFKSFAQAIENLEAEILSKNNQLNYVPLTFFCRKLADIYKAETGKKTSISSAGHNKGNQFFHLVIQCIALVDPAII